MNVAEEQGRRDVLAILERGPECKTFLMSQSSAPQPGQKQKRLKMLQMHSGKDLSTVWKERLQKQCSSWRRFKLQKLSPEASSVFDPSDLDLSDKFG